MRFLSIIVAFILAAGILIPACSSYASNGKKKNSNTVHQANIQAINENGNSNIFGSVLDPNVNQILLLLPKSLLNTVRKLGLNRLSLNLASTIDSTKDYKIPANGISIQRKRIKGQSKLYLSVNFSSTTTSAGITLSPSSLPKGDYKVIISGEELDVSSESFNYQTPALIVGSVKSAKSGFVTIEDLNGNIISDNTVPIGENGGFIAEVRADKLKNTSILRKGRTSGIDKYGLKNNKDENETKSLTEIPEKIDVGIIHAITEKDQFAVTPLNNDVESNALKAKKPIQVSDGSSITAGIGKEYEELASEAAKDQLEKLQTEEEEPDTFQDFGCDIYQFSDKCNGDDNDLNEIGSDFKNFIENTDCFFPEFNLIKESISQASTEDNILIGKGYCESIASTEINEDRPCNEYSKVLSDFNQKVISSLPCPPVNCVEFSAIKPPKCEAPTTGFCNISQLSTISGNSDPKKICQGRRCGPILPECIVKPVKDPFCARIGTDINETDCYNQNFFSHSSVSWTTATNSKGNTYCVPLSTNPQSKFDQFTPDKIAEECEVSTCHKQCEENFRAGLFNNFSSITDGFETCEVCDCHRSCDIEAGRLFDCTGREPSLFSSKCCNKNLPPVSNSPLANFQSFPGKGPVINNYRECLCRNSDNFNENGIVKFDAIGLCKDTCPEGYEIDIDYENICLPVCEEGLVRDQNGICRKKCPPGFIETEDGFCECPEGKAIGPSGKCEEHNCPEYCRSIPFVRKYLEQIFNNGNTFPYPTSGFGSSDFNDITGSDLPPECNQCFGIVITNNCPPGFKKDSSGKCIPTNECGTDQYKDQNGICRCNKDGSISGPDGCKKENRCGSNMLPNNTPGEAQCICPPGLPYWDNVKCIASCPNGSPPASASLNLSPKSPIPCTNSNQRNCEAGEIPAKDNCSCASPGYTSGLVLPCQCPTGYSGAYSSQGCGSYSTNYCSPGISTSTGCTCGPGAYSDSGFCKCSSSNQTYTKEYGCGSSTTNCPYPYITNPSNNPPCKCPDDKPISFSATCVAKCPEGLTAGYPQTYGSAAPGSNYSPMLACLCSDKSYPDQAGKCTTSSTNYCSPGISVGTAGCTCNPSGGGYSFSGYCTCPTNSGAYTKEYGCSSVTTTNCSGNMLPNSNGKGEAQCICPTGLPYFSNNSCVAVCPNGPPPAASYVGLPPKSPIPCDSGGTNSCPSSYPFKCSDGTCRVTQAECSNISCPPATPIRCSDNTCAVTLATCPASTQGTITLTSAVISSSNLAVTFSTSFPNDGSCAYLKDINGVTLYSLFCGSTSGTTVNAPISTFPHTVIVGDQVKICKSNDSTICSSLVTISNTAPTPTPTPTSQDQVTLSSVSISGNGATVTYNKNFSTCAHLLNSNNVILHTQNLFCTSGNNSTTVSVSELNSSFQSGIQVKLCHGNNYNVCSQLVTVTGTVECVPGQSATGCTCGGGAQPTGRNGSCKCSNGSIYHNSNYTNSCRRMCYIGEGYNSSNPCSCGPYGTFGGSGGSCSCTNGRTYDPFNGCERPCNPGEASQGSDACICAGSATYDSQNKCTCPSGQTYSTVGCGASETITLSSVSINGASATISYSVDPYTCLLVKDASNNILKSTNLCGVGSFNSVFPTSDFTPALVSGTQVKLCNQNNSNSCSSLVAVTTTETITLNSVSISGSTVTIDFSATSLGGSNCAVLKDTAGTNMHPSLALCFNNGPISYDRATYFTSSFQSGIQVKLCNTTTGTCSPLVTVTGN